jgi:AGCS family alanine or glycine:cation symporter
VDLASVVLPYLNWYNEYVGRYVLMFLLVPTGVYVTVKMGVPQLTRMRHAYDITMGRFDDARDTGDVNHFQALCTALSGTVGTGNIAGVALAIAIGGPGAMFWIWVTGFLGMATKMVEVTLAQKFRVIHEDGSVSGGGMYYISRGLRDQLGWFAPVMAFLFAVAAVTCSFGTGNMAQSNSIVASMSATVARLATWWTGAALPVEALPWWVKHAFAGFNALLVGLVVVGGIKRIGAVSDKLVPIMAAFYLATGAFVILGAVERVVAIIIVVGAFLSWFVPSRMAANRGRTWAAISVTWVVGALEIGRAHV